MKTYKCSGCPKVLPLSSLLTKQVRWRRAGPLGAVVKSKNIGRFCEDCMTSDDQYKILTRPELRQELEQRLVGQQRDAIQEDSSGV